MDVNKTRKYRRIWKVNIIKTWKPIVKEIIFFLISFINIFS